MQRLTAQRRSALRRSTVSKQACVRIDKTVLFKSRPFPPAVRVGRSQTERCAHNYIKMKYLIKAGGLRKINSQIKTLPLVVNVCVCACLGTLPRVGMASHPECIPASHPAFPRLRHRRTPLTSLKYFPKVRESFRVPSISWDDLRQQDRSANRRNIWCFNNQYGFLDRLEAESRRIFDNGL